MIGVLAAYEPRRETHQLIAEGLTRAGAEATWTPAIESHIPESWRGIVVPPGTPHDDPGPTLSAIRSARERGLPLLGCCGGFQYIVVEFVRSVLGIDDAEHPEANPNAAHPAVTPLDCSLDGTDQPVALLPGSLAARAYGEPEVVEPFFCRYGVNPELLPRIEAAGLRSSGHDSEGQVRVLELDDHPFYLATLYVPSRRAEGPNPAIAAFVAASLH